MNDLFKRLFQFPTQLLLVLIGAVVFLPFLGKVPLFDWDELMPAESSREMLLTSNFHTVQIDFQPFYEKPPLFFWLQSLSMDYLGIDAFGARIPNALVGILTMLVLFNVGRKVYDSVFGVIWALLMAGAALPMFYFRSGFVHPVYDLLTFLSVVYLVRVSSVDDFSSAKQQRKDRWRYLFFSAIFIGLATLAKGPACAVVVMLTATVHLIVLRGKTKLEFSGMVVWLLIGLLIVLGWLGYEIYLNGTQFINGLWSFYEKLIGTQAEGHGGPLFYYAVVLFVGFFPFSLLIYKSFKRSVADSELQQNFKRWMVHLFVINLLVFSLAKTKIVHYSSLCGFPLTFFAAHYLYQLYKNRQKWSAWMSFALLSIGTVLCAGMFAGIYIFAYEKLGLIVPYIKDNFAVEALKQQFNVNPNELWIPVVYFLSLVMVVILMHIQKISWGIAMLIVSSMFFFNTLLVRFVPKGEQISQHAMIEFLEKTAIEKPNYETRGFKSYAHLFYGKKQLNNKSSATYVISKINLVSRIDTSDLEFLYAKNGFVFYRKR